MVTLIGTFIIFAGIIFLGYIAEILFKKTRIPDVLFLIVAGILLGSVFEIVDTNSFGFIATIFVNFALIFLLFQGSLSLDFKTLFASLQGALLLTTISFVITVGVVTVASMLFFQLPFLLALLFGMMLGGTSSAVVIPLVAQLPLDKKIKSILTLESSISDVYGIVGALTVMSIILTGELSGAGVVSSVIGSFAIALFIGGIVGLLWTITIAKYKELASSQMVTVAVFVLLFALVESEFIGASGAIAVLAFGLILGNAKQLLSLLYPKTKKQEDTLEVRNIITSSSKNFYSEISFFVKVFFFVYLGTIMDFSSPIILIIAAIITLLIYVARPLSTKLAFWNTKLNTLNKTTLEVLIPKGLAAAVIVQLAVSKQVPGAEQLVTPVLGVIFISILLTGILVFLNGKEKFNGFGSLLEQQVNKKTKKN
jgi:NhaP-type Na+/H+ or K+/H+ antiporter